MKCVDRQTQPFYNKKAYCNNSYIKGDIMEHSFHHVLMKTYFVLHRTVMTRAKKLGLTSGQPKILEYLSEQEGVEQKTIALHCEIERATAGSILERMEKEGLIERRRKEGNRRSLYVYLTPAGRALAKQTRQIFADAERAAFAGMQKEEVASLRAALERVYENLTRED